MSMYEQIDYVLANYFDVNIGSSEEEILEYLKDELKDLEFRKELEKELKEAFSNSNVSWKEKFTEFNVLTFENEMEAKNYATKMLWQIVFNNKEIPVN